MGKQFCLLLKFDVLLVITCVTQCCTTMSLYGIAQCYNRHVPYMVMPGVITANMNMYLIIVFKPCSHGNHGAVHGKGAGQVSSCRYVHTTAAQEKQHCPEGNVGAILAVHGPCMRRREIDMKGSCEKAKHILFSEVASAK